MTKRHPVEQELEDLRQFRDSIVSSMPGIYEALSASPEPMMTKTDEELEAQRVWRELYQFVVPRGEWDVGRSKYDDERKAKAVLAEALRSPAPLQAQTSAEPVTVLLRSADELELALDRASNHDGLVINLRPGIKTFIQRVRLALASPAPASAQVTEEIAAERERQKSVEGWTAEHDDEHNKGQLARAASAYAYFGSLPEKDTLGEKDRERGKDRGSFVHFIISQLFPVWGTNYGGWGWEWWKPKDRRRDLVKAGALIVAEIERLDRAALHPGREERE